MDIGTPFGTLGARREMMIGFLAEGWGLGAAVAGGGGAPAVTLVVSASTIAVVPCFDFVLVVFTWVAMGRSPLRL